MIEQRHKRVLLGCLGFLSVFFNVVLADQLKLAPLPSRLTLKFAIQQADANHPDIMQRQSKLDFAQADRQDIKSQSRLTLSINGKLRYVDPLAISSSQSHDDSQVGIIAKKRLYDFGRTGSKIKAADFQIRKSELLLETLHDRQKIRIMRVYLSVLLSDLAYARDNEAMAAAYVSFDKRRQRNKLGQISDIELLKSEARYQRIRSARYASDVARRIARSRLANAMNRPGQLSANLTIPTLSFKNRKLPEIKTITRIALKNNRRLLALKAAVAAAHKNIVAAKAGHRPILEAEIGAYDYQKDIGSRDKARASINIRIPIFTGGKVRANVAKVTALYYQRLSELRAWQLKLRLEALKLRQSLYVLRARRDEMDKLVEYRELSLDRSRALYELDVLKTLGDAMVKQSVARYSAAKVKYQLLLAWSRLNLLQGKSIFSGQNQSVNKNKGQE